MNRMLTAFVSVLVVAAMAGAAAAHGLNTKSMVAAAGSQPFFAGYWRCSVGSLNVTPQFGPWLTYRSQSGGGVAQSFVYNDTAGRGWVNVGVDSAGGYWTMTSNGWQGNTLTYSGTYTNRGAGQPQRQVFTRNGYNSMSVATWRNGVVVGQNSCTK